jgi:hypothetical protein
MILGWGTSDSLWWYFETIASTLYKANLGNSIDILQIKRAKPFVFGKGYGRTA